MTEPYELSVKPQARRALEYLLAPSAAFAAWGCINGPLRINPTRAGNPLVAPVQGDWSARCGHYRVGYINSDFDYMIAGGRDRRGTSS